MSDLDEVFESAKQRLANAGLTVSQLHESNRLTIYRPKAVPGNRREEYNTNVIHWKKFEYPDEVEKLDAPVSGLSRVSAENGGLWEFSVWEWCPGPWPGDFVRQYLSLDDALDAIIEYYFADLAWMCNAYHEYRRARENENP